MTMMNDMFSIQTRGLPQVSLFYADFGHTNAISEGPLLSFFISLNYIDIVPSH